MYKGATDNPAFHNSSYAEQSNRGLDALKKGAANMHPLTLLWLVRMYLYRQAKKRSYASKR